jgi:hypothetical protein
MYTILNSEQIDHCKISLVPMYKVE